MDPLMNQFIYEYSQSVNCVILSALLFNNQRNRCTSKGQRCNVLRGHDELMLNVLRCHETY